MQHKISFGTRLVLLLQGQKVRWVERKLKGETIQVWMVTKPKRNLFPEWNNTYFAPLCGLVESTTNITYTSRAYETPWRMWTVKLRAYIKDKHRDYLDWRAVRRGKPQKQGSLKVIREILKNTIMKR